MSLIEIQRAPYHNSHFSPWTPEITAALREKWDYGKSCTIIAKELNGEFDLRLTRNAVIGKVDRINLPKRASSIKAVIARVGRKRHEPRPVKVKPPRLPSYYQAAAIFDSEIPQEQRKTILQLNEHDCRWPVGEVGSPDFFFCGGQAEEDRPYCAGHCVRAFNLEYRARRLAVGLPA